MYSNAEACPRDRAGEPLADDNIPVSESMKLWLGGGIMAGPIFLMPSGSLS